MLINVEGEHIFCFGIYMDMLYIYFRYTDQAERLCCLEFDPFN